MAPTNVELYEALRPTVGEEAARMIAEAWPTAADVATKGDVALLKSDLAQLRSDVRADLVGLRGEFHALRGEVHTEIARQTRWMLTFFIPVWAGTWATTLAILLKP